MGTLNLGKVRITFGGEWDSSKDYELLTIVNNSYGVKYISKQNVPAGTPLSDNAYWEPISGDFVEQYQGAKTEDPATRNDGSPLQEGDLYFNTTSKVIKTYDGNNWTITQQYSDEDILNKLKNVDGDGSGLDADKLDGLESSQFLRSDISNTIKGDLIISKSLPKLVYAGSDTSDIRWWIVQDTEGHLDIQYRDGNNNLISGMMQLRTDGNVTVNNGNKIWHSGNAIKSFSKNGYQKLPNGLIIQWGRTITSSSDGTDVTLPITYPNAILSQAATDEGGACYSTGIYVKDNSTISVYMKNSSGDLVQGGTRWIIIGY